MSRDLQGGERKQIREAIIKAFPEPEDLKMFLDDIDFGHSLDTIAGGKNYTHVVYNLIKWSEANNKKLEQLIESLCRERTGNKEFKNIKDKLFPNFFDCAGIGSNTYTLLNKQWEKICPIIAEVNLDVLAKICKKTLQNSSNYQDILGSYPELIQPENLGVFKTILLEKYHKNNKGIPTIIEFAERLSKEKEVSKDIRDKLNYWVKALAQELNINLPTYENKKLFIFTAINSYLLITITPNSSDTFYLQAELIPNYLDNDINLERIKLEINSDLPNIECSLSDIVDKIYQFIRIAKTEYLNKNLHYKLSIEIFLPLQFIDTNIDLKNVPIGFNREKAFGSEYQFLVRSLDRFISHDGEYLNRLYLRWNLLNDWIENSISKAEIQNKIHHISQVDDCNWEEIETELQIEEKFGVKITCCLPENKSDKEELFITALRGGVPILLWTRCDLVNIDHEFDQLLNIDFFKRELTRMKSVWELRKVAHAKRDKENHLGYHLGFLCDNPHRVPFNLMLQNQSLIETGM